MATSLNKYILLRVVGIILPIWLTFALFVISIFYIFVPAFKAHLVAGKKQTIQQLVDSNVSILEQYDVRVKNGELTRSMAQAKAIEQIRLLRYGPEGKDYFWINDLHPFMIMHPFRPDLEGRDLTTLKDSQGNFPFIAMVSEVMNSGSGYVDYYWQWKDLPDKVVPKTSYVRGFEPWGWILGTGLYTDDVNAEIELILEDLSVIFISILFIMMGISVYLTIQTTRIGNDRVRAMAQLSASEKMHRDFIRNAPIGMFTANTKGEFTYLNKSIESIVQRKQADLLGRTYEALVHPQDIPVIRSKIIKRVKGDHRSIPYDVRVVTPAGETVWVRLNSTSLFTERDGESVFTGIQTFVEEITRQKTAESALRSSEQWLKAILEANPDAMVVYNLEGHPEYINPAFTQIFGWTFQDLEGRRIPFVPEDQKEISLSKIREIYEHKKPVSFETTRYTKDGNILNIRLSAAVKKDESGDIQGMVVNLTDITNEKAREAQYKQAQKMESIGTLAGGIAHDFNNILSVILGNSELAIDDIPESNPAYDCVRQIQEAGIKASGIVKQLLGFSRYSEQTFVPVRLSSVIADSLTLLRSLIPTSVDIRARYEASNGVVLADSVQLNQIMMNLCVNASQAMEEHGSIEIDLTRVQVDGVYRNRPVDLARGAYLRLRIRDTGPGIAAEHMDRIFDPYFTTKEIGEGSGMGLSVVHGIVTGHAGIIYAGNHSQGGACFDILFPEKDVKPAVQSYRIENILPGNERILLVDDEPGIADTVQVALEKKGYLVTKFYDPRQALKAFESDPDRFDLVITDMTMPGLTGDRLTRQLVSIRPDMPVIISTGHSTRIDREQAKEIGAAALVVKPVPMEELAGIIRHSLSEKNS